MSSFLWVCRRPCAACGCVSVPSVSLLSLSYFVLSFVSLRQNSAINKRSFNNSLRDSRKIFFESDSVTRTTGATNCHIAENGPHSRRLRYLCGKSLNVLVYGNRIYREKDLRDDAGVIQRPLGESRRPKAQKRRRAAGKVAHINRRFYYKPEEVKRLIPLVGTLYPGGK